MGPNPSNFRRKKKLSAAFVPMKGPDRSRKPFEQPKPLEDYRVDKITPRQGKPSDVRVPDFASTDKLKATRLNPKEISPEVMTPLVTKLMTATDTALQPETNPTSVGLDTIAKDKPNKTIGDERMTMRGRRPGGNEDHIPTDRPTGLARYGNGAYTDDQSLPFPGQLNENPIYPQEEAKWDAFQHVRILSTVMNFGFFPQASFNTAASIYDNTQGSYFLNFFNELSVNYRANKNANKDFSDNFTLDRVFIYFYDTTRLYAELMCLMARQAYMIDKTDPNNPANNLTLDRISIYLNTTEFWELRNRMANALATSILPEYIWSKIRFMVQLHRIGPMETATKHMFNTTAMDTLLLRASVSANDDTKNTLARTKYIAEINDLINLVEFGRSSSDPAIQRHVTNAIKVNVFTDSSGTPALTRKQRNAISDFLQYCGIKYKSTGNLPPFPSHSVYNPKMCDIISNISPYILYSGTASRMKAFPPILPDVNTQQKPNLETVSMYTSMRQSSEQDATTLETMASKFKGCSPLYMDYPKNLHGVNPYTDFSNLNFRMATNYVCERSGLNSQRTTPFVFKPLITTLTVNAEAFVESNFTTKLFYDGANSTVKYSSQNDDDNVPLYYVTWGGILQSIFNTKESFFNR